jgi:hypothetical protein
MINITTRIGTLFGGLINATSAFVAGLIGSLNFTPGSSATGSITATNPATESFTFTRASTGTFVGSNGLLQTAASGVSRIDYLGNTAGHILLEPAATNTLARSNEFDNGWSLSGVTVTQDNYVSPTGSTDAWLVTAGTGTGAARARRAGNPPSPSTASIFAKKGNSDRLVLSIGGTKTIMALFDLTNGVVLDTNSAGGAGAVTRTSIEDYGNGWYRCSFTGDPNGPSQSLGFGPYAQDTIGGNINYQWDRNGETIYVYGAMVEQTSYPTSYIETTSASVTRVTETAADAGDSTLFNDSEGVLFIETAALSDDTLNRYIAITDGTASNRVLVGYSPQTNRIRALISDGGVFTADISYDVTDRADFSKIAVKYKANDVALWVDGVERATDTSATMPSGLDELDCDSGAGSSPFYGKIKQIKVFKEALSDEDLQTLTT